jgi:glyoxylase-like metal-dependent hydrolase (beta-lactamase superfamily II)
MDTRTPAYEVYAIKYGHHERRSPGNFLGGDSHDVPMPLDYFVWAVVGNGRAWLVDTGFDKASGDKRGGRNITRPIDQGLRAIGVDPADVQDVVITHMHYDHAGNRDLFPHARYHVQDKEMAFCTGRCMCHRPLATHYEPDDVTSMVNKVFAGRVVFHDGDAELAPGLSVHHMGGHTAGLQVVRVHTAQGWLVLASDATHFYANIEQRRPFPALYNLGDVMETYQRVNSLADAPGLVIPGHDPLVLERFPPHSREHAGIVRLDGVM